MKSNIDDSQRRQLVEERQAHLWFLESMDRINRAIQGTNDLEAMMSAVLGAALEIFECDRAWLAYPCDPEAASWRALMEQTRPEFPGAFAQGVEVQMDAHASAILRATRAARGAVLLGPGHEIQVSAVLQERYGIRSQMIMAIYPKGDRPYAFGLHQCSRGRFWTPHEQRLFEEIGHRLADALTGLLMFRSLRESERRLDEAQRIAHVGYWERDLVAERIRLSDETCRIFGVPTEREIDLARWHERWVSLIHPEDRPRIGEATTAALRGGANYDVEYRIVRPNGDVRMVRSQGEVTWDDSGQPMRMFGVMQDITELRQAESELLASELRFRTFVDHATDALFVHDQGGKILDVNRQACEGLGFTREELIGMTPSDFDSCVAGDIERVRRINQRLDAGEAFTFETTHRRKDGSTYPAEVRTRPFSHGGRRFALALVRDITERKRAEEEREQIRRLEGERESAITSERARLAGEIHDTLAQGLAMIVMQLADAEAKLGPLWSRAEKPLNTVRELAVESLAYARRSLSMLRPSVTVGGLTRAVRDIVDSLRRHFSGELTLSVRGKAVLLPAPVESALAKIAREALSNAIRHSGATEIYAEIEFAEGGAVRLVVIDAGVGFDTSTVRPDAYGLISMNDRASRAGVALTFVTEPGAGTEVVATWSP